MKNKSDVTKHTEFLEIREKIVITFGGENPIDTDLFFNIDNAIKEIKAMIMIAAKEKYPDCSVRLEITRIESGSFQFFINVILKIKLKIKNLLLAMGFEPTVKGVMEMVVLFMTIVRYFKGEEPTKIEKKDDKMTTIYNRDSEPLSVPYTAYDTFYNNRNNIRKSVDSICKSVVDGDRKHISIETEHEKVEISKSECADIVRNSAINDNQTAKKTTKIIKQELISTELPVRKPDLSGEAQWGFKYNNKNINVTIVDKDFLNTVKQGEIKLSNGVKIPCELQIEYELNENQNTIPNSARYTILEVTGNIIEPEEDSQMEFNIDDDDNNS